MANRESAIAPKFNIVSKPNEWTKTVQTAAARGELTEAKQLQLRFWTAFASYMGGKSKVGISKPLPQHWMNHSIGRSGAHLTTIASTWDSQKGPELRVELYIDGKDSKQWFAALAQDKEAIEREAGQELIWYNPENAKMCRVYIRLPGNWPDESQWPSQHEWLRRNLELFTKVFQTRIRNL